MSSVENKMGIIGYIASHKERYAKDLSDERRIEIAKEHEAKLPQKGLRGLLTDIFLGARTKEIEEEVLAVNPEATHKEIRDKVVSARTQNRAFLVMNIIQAIMSGGLLSSRGPTEFFSSLLNTIIAPVALQRVGSFIEKKSPNAGTAALLNVVFNSFLGWQLWNWLWSLIAGKASQALDSSMGFGGNSQQQQAPMTSPFNSFNGSGQNFGSPMTLGVV
jgi:hypothetical protein